MVPAPWTLDELLSVPLETAREMHGRIAESADGPKPIADVRLHAPVGGQEVWAAGVTYRRSLQARSEESGLSDLYDQAYRAERPELFFKAPAWRVVGPGEDIGIRADASWNVPEPELALVLNSAMAVLGYTIGNDVSSRDIEGENPLYLAQAKVYDRSCALGPAIVPVWIASSGPFSIEMEIRSGDVLAFSGETSTARLQRTPEELAAWLGRALRFPVGAVMLTGTGVVPEDATLREGDVVTVSIGGLGRLENQVRTVGRAGPVPQARGS